MKEKLPCSASCMMNSPGDRVALLLLSRIVLSCDCSGQTGRTKLPSLGPALFLIKLLHRSMMTHCAVHVPCMSPCLLGSREEAPLRRMVQGVLSLLRFALRALCLVAVSAVCLCLCRFRMLPPRGSMVGPQRHPRRQQRMQRLYASCARHLRFVSVPLGHVAVCISCRSWATLLGIAPRRRQEAGRKLESGERPSMASTR